MLHNVSYATLRRGALQPEIRSHGPSLRLWRLAPLLLALLCEPLAQAASQPLGTPPVWGYLDNGMGYVLLESHAAPLVGSSVIVHCGSSREDFATNGASHFLEHLLFNGTETRSQEQLYADVDGIGGYNNATTAKTHVVYMMVTPAENMRRGLEIQKDMLFHSTLAPEKVEKERGIILEELAKDRDTGSFDADRLLDLAAFGPSGAGLPVLGSPQSIQSLSRDAIASFYHALYTPQNMTLVVIGDFSSREMEQSIREIFGSEPAGAPPPPIREVSPIWDRSPIVDTYPGKSTLMEWTWPGPDPREAGFTAFECVASLLGEDDSAPLNRLVRDRYPGKVLSSGGRIETLPGRSFYRYRIEADPSIDWRTVAKDLPSLVSQARTPPGAAAIDAWRVSQEAEEFYLREKPHYYGVMEGDRIAAEGIDGIVSRTGRLEELSPQEVREAMGKWASAGYRLAVLLPAPESATDSLQAATRKGVRTTLANGVDMLVLSSPESPVLALHLFIEGRSQAEPTGMDGAVELLHRLLPIRTAHLDPAAMDLRLRSIGGQLTTADNPDIPYDDFYSVPDYSFVKLQTLDRYAPQAFSLLGDMFSSPNWTDRDFEDVRSSMLAHAERSATSAGATARSTLRETLWDGKPRGRAIFGTPASLKTMSAPALRDLARRYFVGQRMLLVVATSLPPDEIEGLAARSIGEIPAGDPPPPPDERSGVSRILRSALGSSDSLPHDLGAVEIPDSTVLRVRKVGGRQASVIWTTSLGMLPVSEEPAAEVWNAALSSQIEFQLREREGLAYSIGSSVDRLDDGTLLWSASAGTGAKSILRITAGMQEALAAALSQAPDSNEVRKEGEELYGATLRRRASRMNRAYAAGLAILAGRDPAGIDEEMRAPTRVTREQIVSMLSGRKRGPGVLVIAE